jgi:hypothetical protein
MTTVFGGVFRVSIELWIGARKAFVSVEMNLGLWRTASFRHSVAADQNVWIGFFWLREGGQVVNFVNTSINLHVTKGAPISSSLENDSTVFRTHLVVLFLSFLLN